jgi:selenocysteine lyase/cysteine desulfurase
VDHLPALFNQHTKLLVFPHCSNILGEINPVAHIASLARAKGVKTLVDGVSYAGHGLPDVDALGVDIYLFSLYKVYGTHQGVMVVRQQMDACLSNQGHYFNDHLREKRLTPAGPDHAQIAAAAGVCDYLSTIYQHHATTDNAHDQDKNKVVHDLLRQAEVEVLEPLLEFFNEHQKITLIGPKQAANRAPTVSILVQGHKAFDLASALGAEGLMCGAGHFYSMRLLQAMGIDAEEGVLRFSLVHYTSAQDVQKLTQTLARMIA